MRELEGQLSGVQTDQELAALYKDILYTAIDMSDIERQYKYSKLALPLSFSLPDVELRVYSEVANANALSLEGDYTNARDIFAQTRKLAQVRGTEELVFFVDAVEANLGPETGNYLEGIARLVQFEPTLDQTPSSDKLRMIALNTIAFSYGAADDINGIIKYYGQALQTAQRSNLAIDRETIVYNLALSLTNERNFEEAALAYQTLKAIMDQTQNYSNEFYLYFGLALLEYTQGNYEASNTYGEKSLTLTDKGATPQHIANINGLTALNYARLGNPAKAEERLALEESFYTNNPEAGLAYFETTKKLTHAFIAASRGQTNEAFKLLDEAREEQLSNQTATFRDSLAELQSNLQVIIAKQETESKLEAAETAYLRATWVAIFLGSIGVIIIFFQQRKHTRQLTQSIEEARTANQAKSEFLANMSHELRTPLNAILGFSEMMSHQVFGKLGARQYEEYVGHIHNSGTHLLDIINDILDLSKIESGKLQLLEEKIDLCSLFQDVKAVLEPKALTQQITISVVVDHEVPYLKADRRLLKQILLNLLSNGVKFTPAYGSVKMLGLILDDGCIQIEVSDTGSGMTPEELKIALTPFGQAGTTSTRSHEGTGLGLPLVKDLVELHGGTLKINTYKNIGTSVLITFPSERSGGLRTSHCDDCDFKGASDVCDSTELAS
ncbi:HAMP domain-containing histidine kinase [Kordiimonas sp. SCSIO 12603]|uniref:sensor histidine kinase n=1 Tax=Kordiimonas sp. SCSIO 12603 TaxID=2829596 RepID=UPI0021065F6E|nr:HAMP domain-containing sensor histidine kinase [Kordiimonas sp. SCSIO 12603]UTW59819.1 HAMP domain-containing histidine kinase [Kordiimonas sp. SCSIO 12603]